MSVITLEGCIIHRHVEFNRIENGYQVFKCADCGFDVEQEAEDSCGA